MADETEQTPKPPSTWRIKLKFLGIGILIGGLAGSGGVGKFLWDAHGQIDSMTADMHKMEARQGLFEAQAAVSAASIELRRDNFGDAKASTESARARLGTLDAAAAGVDAEILQTIQKRLDSVNIAASGDIVEATGGLDDVSLALERLINPAQ